MAFVNRLLAKQGKEYIRAAFAANRLVAPKISPSALQCRTYHADDHGHHDEVYCKMDEFPVPKANWQEAYDAQQAKYNKQLAMGATSLLLVILYYYVKQPVDWGMAPTMSNKDLSFWTDYEKEK